MLLGKRCGLSETDGGTWSRMSAQIASIKVDPIDVHRFSGARRECVPKSSRLEGLHFGGSWPTCASAISALPACLVYTVLTRRQGQA